MDNPHYFATSEAAMQATAAVLWGQFLAYKRQHDPDVVTPEGTVMYRSPFTGAIEPDAPRSTGWATPMPAVQGFVLPQPQHEAYSDPDGVVVTTTANPWPSPSPIAPADPLEELPEWKLPGNAAEAYIEGAWVRHQGRAYCCITPGLTVEPEPRSTVWRVSPDPGPLPWKPVTGYENAYRKDALVTENGKCYRSTFNGNSEPPGDPRYWVEVPMPKKAAVDWSKPVPGDGASLHALDDEVIHIGKRWKSKSHLNAEEPGTGERWEEVPPA